jgi:hypothetical protein
MWINITNMTAGAKKTQQTYKNHEDFLPSISSIQLQNRFPPKIQLIEIVWKNTKKSIDIPLAE